MNRREFMRRAAAAAAVAPSLLPLIACADDAGLPTGPINNDHGYGPLLSAGPELDLPEGFSYRKLGLAGTMMSDGNITPGAHDGMAAFALPDGRTRLIRNHEVRTGPSASTVMGDASRAYDSRAGGGTTSLDIVVEADGTRAAVRDFVSLNGTIVNCAGGPTPWGSWLSCEESTAGTQAGWLREHGYVFEVPAAADGPIHSVPIRAMGRFVHEAVAVDPQTGWVYQTEDRGTAGFYRFVPLAPGNLTAGGNLQMLKVSGNPNYGTETGQEVGLELDAVWVDIADPDPVDAEARPLAVFDQGYAAGAASFARLEGCWYGDGSIYFHATSGGDVQMGQVWQYRPDGVDSGFLTLIFESPGPEVLGFPDNLTVSPRGGIVICEDRGGASHLRGLTKTGVIFPFARNKLGPDEFAGACFSPDGETMFVNLQRAGITLAIWGPWENGAL